MKRLAKFGWIDIAIRKEKQLLILICESNEQAKQLFQLLNRERYKISVKLSTDRLIIAIFVSYKGHQIMSISREHQCFRFTDDFQKNILFVTTGTLLPENSLGYLKDKLYL